MTPVSTGVKIENIRIYLYIKWFVLAIVFLLNIFENLAGLMTVMQATIAYMGIFVAAVTAFLLEWSIRKNKLVNFIAHVSLSIDILVIVLVLYFHGGIENSWLFLAVFVIFLASYIFGFLAGFIYASFSFIIVFAMSVMQYLEFIPTLALFNLPEAHWKNIQYITDYVTGMFVLYFASAFSIGLLTRLAAQRAERLNGYRANLEKTIKNEEETKKKIVAAKEEMSVKDAELERLQRISAEQQLKLIELKREIEKLRGMG